MGEVGRQRPTTIHHASDRLAWVRFSVDPPRSGRASPVTQSPQSQVSSCTGKGRAHEVMES